MLPPFEHIFDYYKSHGIKTQKTMIETYISGKGKNVEAMPPLTHIFMELYLIRYYVSYINCMLKVF
jgi:hypothetical protein